MAIRCDAQQLQAELVAAGIPRERIDTVRSGGPLETVEWVTPPSVEERQQAQRVMASHDPERADRERRAALDRLRASLATWDAATPEQRLAAAKLLLAWTLRGEAGG